MIPRAREQRNSRLRFVDIILTVAGLVLLCPALVYAAIDYNRRDMSNATIILGALSVGAIASGVGLMFGRRIASANYDPNNEPVELRKQMGSELSVSRQEFEQIERDIRRKS